MRVYRKLIDIIYENILIFTTCNSFPNNMQQYGIICIIKPLYKDILLYYFSFIPYIVPYVLLLCKVFLAF